MTRRRPELPPFVLVGSDTYAVVGWDEDDFYRGGDPLLLRRLSRREEAIFAALRADAAAEAFARTEGLRAMRAARPRRKA